MELRSILRWYKKNNRSSGRQEDGHIPESFLMVSSFCMTMIDHSQPTEKGTAAEVQVENPVLPPTTPISSHVPFISSMSSTNYVRTKVSNEG
ncbi:hypothetical protein AVEN_110609-1 [Araneus ventricosus]|uniref:Uncharacterized protein n=1 Tax=Araneus ventricosus TaxID=182803 RepID=A0A4Y2AWL9_ARAVE|nr:hypothetical protein AVEN_110609-1 [Araneus ventricosus]